MKDGQPDQPFFLVFETDENIGIGKRALMLFLQPSVNLEQAKELANRLNTDGARLSVQWTPSSLKTGGMRAGSSAQRSASSLLAKMCSTSGRSGTSFAMPSKQASRPVVTGAWPVKAPYRDLAPRGRESSQAS